MSRLWSGSPSCLLMTRSLVVVLVAITFTITIIHQKHLASASSTWELPRDQVGIDPQVPPANFRHFSHPIDHNQRRDINKDPTGRLQRRSRRTNQPATMDNHQRHWIGSPLHGSSRKRAATDRLEAARPKHFRSHQQDALSSLSSSQNHTRALPSSDHNNNTSSLNSTATITDVNNNNDADNFVNVDLNSTIHSPRNISSVDGNIDLSQYANEDVDRLYNDALLVYMKNFNDTLPVRRQTFQLGNTTMMGQVPTYSTSRRVSRHTGW